MNNKSKLIKRLLYLVLAALVIGIFKVEFFLQYVQEDIKLSTRVISYITLSLSVLFFYLIIITAIATSYYVVELIKLGENFNPNRFFYAIKIFIWFLILNEISKLLITFFTFNGFSNVSTEDAFMSQIESNSLWLDLITFSDFYFIFSGAVLFAFSLRKKNEISYIESFCSAIPLCLFFVMFRSIV